eukprot:Tamp_27162.p1 GENE.Tamp_27162~~Tamp_27162.p1  ORF type:complete len:111 (-),score=0.28 Tamp_27162:427-759(-)
MLLRSRGQMLFVFFFASGEPVFFAATGAERAAKGATGEFVSVLLLRLCSAVALGILLVYCDTLSNSSSAAASSSTCLVVILTPLRTQDPGPIFWTLFPNKVSPSLSLSSH